MKAETKYNIGDRVWTIDGGSIRRMRIDSVVVSFGSDGSIRNRYYLSGKRGFGIYREEEKLYASREDMRKALGPEPCLNCAHQRLCPKKGCLLWETYITICKTK